jgi:hypothetical protein
LVVLENRGVPIIERLKSSDTAFISFISVLDSNRSFQRRVTLLDAYPLIGNTEEQESGQKVAAGGRRSRRRNKGPSIPSS